MSLKARALLSGWNPTCKILDLTAAATAASQPDEQLQEHVQEQAQPHQPHHQLQQHGPQQRSPQQTHQQAQQLPPWLSGSFDQVAGLVMEAILEDMPCRPQAGNPTSGLVHVPGPGTSTPGAVAVGVDSCNNASAAAAPADVALPAGSCSSGGTF